MTGTLILLLFLLNCLLIFAVVLLYLRQNRLIDIEKQQRRALEESEEMLLTLLAEIKEENERFLAKAKELRKGSYNESTAPGRIIPPLAEVSEPPKDESCNEKHSLEQLNEGIPRKELTEPSLAEQAADLKSKGLTVGQIAKTLQKGKTEIELLLKFNK